MPLHTEDSTWFRFGSDLGSEPVYMEITEPVRIPTPDGKKFAETVPVKVAAWRDPEDGEIYLDSDAMPILERVKARHVGLLTTNQIKGSNLNLFTNCSHGS